MSSHYDNLGAILKKDGYSLTKTRKIIFDLLLNQEPQSMQVLTQRAKNKTDRATVYRTIELFEKLGVAHRINVGWKYKIELSDIFHAHHHHFYCMNCGKTCNLEPNPMLETMIDSIADREGYSPRGHSLEITGLCSNCSKT